MNFAREKGLAGLRAAVALVLALIASTAFATPPLARMDDNDRQRLRQDLRQQERARARSERESAQRGNDAAPPWVQRSAPAQPAPDAWQGQSEQGQGGSRQGWSARGATGPERPRLSPEERQQLRQQLRERQQGWRR
jgi:hypothetical protein